MSHDGEAIRPSGAADRANPLVPVMVTVRDVVRETDSGLIRTLVIDWDPAKCDHPVFDYRPGQCSMISRIGVGESMIAMASTATRRGTIEFTVKDAGRNTHALHQVVPGDRIGLRGPYGNGYPLDQLRGRDLLIVGGGIGISGLRALVNHCLDRRGEFGHLTIVYGAQSPGEMCYKDEIYGSWPSAPGVDVRLTVDTPAGGWSGFVGFVPAYLKALAPQPDQATAVVCGPPAMIRHTAAALQRLGFAPGNILISMELKMQCGVGRCGRCNIGGKYVCRDGPVFSLAELGELPEEY